MVNPNSLKKLVPQCFSLRTTWEGQDDNATSGVGGHTTLWWKKDFGHHHYGDYSMAAIKGNIIVEDHSQLESGPMGLDGAGPYGTFVGVYDGHGGPDTSRFISDRLFNHMKRITTERGGMSMDVISRAFMATEEEFLAKVRREWESRPMLASVGSCCLVGVVCGGMIYVASAGDSRAVLGRSSPERHMEAIQLSKDHNASVEVVRDELTIRHPNDEQIVFQKDGVWRVKGIIQVSRSIGDAYLKRREFNRPPLIEKYRVPGIFEKPILLPEPTVEQQGINPRDEFIIFASDGLWDNLTNQEAVAIVNSKSRKGIAKTLVKAALKALAQARGLKYKELKKIEIQDRRKVHDDITVVVLFLDSKLISSSSSSRSSGSRRRPTVSERTYALDINRAGTSSSASVDTHDDDGEEDM